MARSIDEILAHYERLNRALDRQEKREIFGQKVILARKDWIPATKQTRLSRASRTLEG
jgi:hypothetical protein